MKMPLTAAVLLLIIILVSSCLGGCQVNRSTAWPVPDWTTSTPESQGMDSQFLVNMFQTIQTKRIHLHSLLIARNGEIVLEAYFDPYQPDMPHEVASITKSVIGTLVGIAIKEGKIQSVDVPVLSFFPDRSVANLDDRKQALTIKHLLTLTDGFQCDFATTETEMEKSLDWTQFVLDLPMKYQPGDQWYYCSSSVHLLSAVLSQAVGTDARTYANEKLFKPLGIPEIPESQWGSDPQGVTKGSAALILAPRDLARYALLYTRGGKWNGTQILPKGWVEDSLTQHAYAGNEKEFGGAERRYGYLWSIFPTKGYCSAIGMGGQHIHFIPEKDLVVIYNASTMTNVLLFELLDDYILPSVMSDKPLPENPQALAELTALIDQVTYPQEPLDEMPALASQVSGKIYQLNANYVGLKEIEFIFDPGADTAQVVFDGAMPNPIGLDNLFRISDDPNFGKIALKGWWKTENQFVFEEIVPGSFSMEFEAKVIFKDDLIELQLRNTFIGGMLVIKGQQVN
jgi:CubicO group peptidase (beta-lactamase class C family)